MGGKYGAITGPLRTLKPKRSAIAFYFEGHGEVVLSDDAFRSNSHSRCKSAGNKDKPLFLYWVVQLDAAPVSSYFLLRPTCTRSARWKNRLFVHLGGRLPYFNKASSGVPVVQVRGKAETDGAQVADRCDQSLKQCCLHVFRCC